MTLNRRSSLICAIFIAEKTLGHQHRMNQDALNFQSYISRFIEWCNHAL